MRGLDIAPPVRVIRETATSDHVSAIALVGSDYAGLRPAFQVDVGDNVQIGQPLFVDSRRPRIAYCSPVGGTVTEIRRGRRRTLDMIRVAREHEQSKSFELPDPADADGVRRLLLESGHWPAFRSRPFDKIPDPELQPAAIFVTALETEPFSVNLNDILRENENFLRNGLAVIRSLTGGPVFLCHALDTQLDVEMDRVRCVKFSGPHPAGLPGTHIHHLMPVSRRRHVWHIGFQDVVAIGRLMETGWSWNERYVGVGLPATQEAIRTRAILGADLLDIVDSQPSDGNYRFVSGSLLSGRPARYLGRYHTQVTVVPREPVPVKQTIFERVARFLDDGTPGAIIPIAAHEKAMAVDIPAVPLLRALSVGDAETAERLGCLALAESDMALLTHVCPSKQDYGALLRKTLDEIETWL